MNLRNFPQMPLNDTVQEIPQALSISINQIVYDLKRAGEEVATFSLGEAFFDIPLFDWSKIDINKGYHYSDSQGIPELRRKIANYYRQYYNAPVDANKELIITAGSKAAIYMAMLATMKPGDEVLIHEPSWLSYPQQARLVGAIPRFVSFDVAIDDFPHHLTAKTRMVVINNPNNPSGRLYTALELKSLYDICRAKSIYLLVDEAYSDFVIDQPFVSLAELVPDKDGIIVVNSLSKNMGISGWRIGYAIAGPEVINSLVKLNQHLITCAPSLLLYYCAYYFDDIIGATLGQARNVVKKRNRVAEMIDELNIQRLPGNSTFYFFLGIGDFPGSSTEFALFLLLEKHIAVVPGSAYGASTDRFVRFAIGTESEETIWESLLIIKQTVEKPRINRAALHEKASKYAGIMPFLNSAT